ncbi:hypothetical protein ACP4OV_017507 [Aristida adscensionis]
MDRRRGGGAWAAAGRGLEEQERRGEMEEQGRHDVRHGEIGRSQRRGVELVEVAATVAGGWRWVVLFSGSGE